jgi:hypothetical protein
MARLTFFFVAASVAVSAGPISSGADKENLGEVEVLFANGSLVRMTMVQDKIDIDTLYGKLSVPLQDIRRIEFGLHAPAGMAKKVETAVKQLGSGDFKERAAAVRTLVELGAHAYPALVKSAESPDPEVAKRAADALTRMKAKVPAKELVLGEDDRVVTAKFVIVGRIVTSTIKARTEYFGETRLSLHQLRQLRVLAEPRNATTTIDAGKYAAANEWLDTSFIVDGASILTITATGQVDLRPQEPGTVVSTP